MTTPTTYAFATGEHEYEPLPGLPARLPAGERLLWQGTPQWWAHACGAFHLRGVALYFAAMLAWRAGTAAADGGALAALQALAWPLPLAAAGLALLALLAALSARTTAYTLTDRRVVMRVGIVLSVSFNVPLSQIEAVALRRRGARQGDIALALLRRQRIAYLHLWPHARPWRLNRTEPMLRALADAPAVAALLADALRATLAAPAVPAPATSGPATSGPAISTPAGVAPRPALAPAVRLDAGQPTPSRHWPAAA